MPAPKSVLGKDVRPLCININKEVYSMVEREAKVQMRNITAQINFMLKDYFRLRKEYEKMNIIEDLKKPL